MSNGKYGDLIKQARKQENHQASKPDDQITRHPEAVAEATEPEEEVNLCVKVPKSLRRHWAAESKRTGITMTSVIVEALTAQFGKPEERE
jgi:hypothetical protein